VFDEQIKRVTDKFYHCLTIASSTVKTQLELHFEMLFV
jgi:hypothetical protein